MINASLLQMVINASNDGIVVAEKEGEQDNILIYVNPAFERMTGYSSEEILYQDCRFCRLETVINQVCSLFARHCVKAVPAGRSCATIARMARRSGTNCHCRR